MLAFDRFFRRGGGLGWFKFVLGLLSYFFLNLKYM